MLSLDCGKLIVLASIVVTFEVEAQTPFPYQLSTEREIGLTAGGAALVAAALVLYSAQEPLTPAEVAILDSRDVNGFDRSATERWSESSDRASDVITFTLLFSPVGLAVTPPGSRAAATLGVMYGQTLLIQIGLTQTLKGLTERTRPFVYNDDPDIPDELRFEVSARRSFSSGHTANAFMAATFLSSVYAKLHPQSSARKWIWAGSLTAAGTVGYLRYRAGKHFPTDIIAGAAIGAATGYLVPKLHEVGSQPVSLMPTGRGVAVSVSF